MPIAVFLARQGIPFGHATGKAAAGTLAPGPSVALAGRACKCQNLLPFPFVPGACCAAGRGR
ncbi:hypothetical protein N9166_00595 [bacterium]|nr:hypothetical protein [bacterium]